MSIIGSKRNNTITQMLGELGTKKGRTRLGTSNEEH